MNRLANLLSFERDDILRKTLDTSFAYAEFTADGIVKDCNKNFASLYGYSNTKDILGKPHRLFVEDNFANTPEYQKFWSDLAIGDSKSGDFQRIDKDGNRIFVRAAYVTRKDLKGNVKSIVKIASDISNERLALEQLLATKQSIDLSYAHVTFDIRGYVRDANDIFVKTMGYTSLEEIKGRHHSIFVKETYRDSDEYRDFWDNLRAGKVQTGEFVRISKKGDTIWLQSSYSPVYDKEGKITSIVKVAADITQKRLSSDLARDLKNTIDISFGYIQFDPRGNILEVNENFHKLLGYEEIEEVLGQHHSLFVEEGYASSTEYSDFWRDLNAGKTKSGQFERKAKNGDKVWIQAAYTPLRNEKDEVVTIVKIAADITANKLEAARTKSDLKDELFTNITEIASAIGEIASGARTQAEKIDKSSESIELSLATSKQVSEKAAQIAEAATKGKENSEIGDMHVQELVANMANLTETAIRTEASMQELTKKTEEVNFILNVMQEIANNTNLLALNAAIEASKAGEAGRGFAVIAQEIRLLAENAKNAVSEIEEKILAVNADSQEVAEAMKEVSSKVGASKEATESVKVIFGQIQQSSDQTAKLSGDILTDSTSQNSQLKQLVTTSEEIVVISEETAAGTEQVSAASSQLEDRVSKF